MDPITQKIISLTETPIREPISSVFQTYAWGHPDNGSNGTHPGVHTSRSSVDMTKGGMVMGKRWDTSADWYVADTVSSPLDGSQIFNPIIYRYNTTYTIKYFTNSINMRVIIRISSK